MLRLRTEGIVVKLMIAAALLAATVTSGARAQTAAFYSPADGTGSACTRAAPCADLQAAYGVAGDGGTIFHVSAGHFASGVSAPFAVNHQGFGQASSVTFFAYGGITPKTITIRDMSVSRSWYSNYAAYFSSAGGSVTLENVAFSTPAAANMSGVLFAPGGTATLSLKNVSFNSFSTGTGAAIRIVTGGHNVNVSLENVQVSGGVKGIVIDAGGGGFAKVSIKDSTFANIAGLGIGAYSGTGNIRLYLDNVTSVNNTHGLVAHGARTIAWLGSSTIAGNSIGVLRQSGGAVQSYKDNYIFNNNTDGTPLTNTSYPPAATGMGDEVAAAGK